MMATLYDKKRIAVLNLSHNAFGP